MKADSGYRWQADACLWAVLLLNCCSPPRLLALGQDIALTYTSQVDGTVRAYRVYAPNGYNGTRAYPLVVALHGTVGDESSFFDDPRYQAGAIKLAADRYQMLVACPDGRGAREYRGMAEHDVFAVIAEVEARFKVDRNRLYLTGHSMGGTGAAQIALHHPGVFAAVAPLAPAYGWPSLAVNGALTPFWWIAGELDKDAFLVGTRYGVERMRRVNPRMAFDLLPGEGHYGPVQDFHRVFRWFSKHRLDPLPKSFTFVVETPLHSHAYWTRIDALQHPGRLGTIEASIDDTRIRVSTRNLSRLSILPAAALIPTDRDIIVRIDGWVAYKGRVGPEQELAASWESGRWTMRPRLLQRRELTSYRFTPIGEVAGQFDMRGTEATLANWIADAMREATGADAAIINRQYYRGLPLRAGQSDFVDVLHAMGVFDWNLIVVELKGKEIVEILDDNVPDPAKAKPYSKDGPDANRLAQVSGIRYSFDSSRPSGSRIVESDIEMERTYIVALEGQNTHWDTLLQAGHFGKLRYRVTEIPLSTALYGHALRHRPIHARREGRVRDVTPLLPAQPRAKVN